MRDPLGGTPVHMRSTQGLDPSWLRYRWLRNSYLASMAAWALVMAFMIADALVDPAQHLIRNYWWLGAPIFLGGMILQYFFRWWPCPRCGQPYFKKSIWTTDVFTDECVNCGLPKWANPADTSRAA